MTSLHPVLFATFFCSTAAVRWHASLMMGTRGHLQPTDMILDLNSPDTLLFNKEQQNGRFMYRGYDTTVSPAFRYTTRGFNKAFEPPFIDVASNASGAYAQDEVCVNWERYVNSYFGLVNSIEGGDLFTNLYGPLFSGILGFGRRKSDLTDFRPYVLTNGNTFCHVTECKKTDWQRDCWHFSESRKHGGPEAYTPYNGSVYYTDVTGAYGNENSWTMPVNGFSFGKFESKKNFSATLTTFSKYITVPDALFRHIVKTLNATSNGKVYVVDSALLETAPPLVLDIIGVKVPVLAMDYLDSYGTRKAWLRIRGGATDEWILGEPFIDSVSLCLDFEKSLLSLYRVPLHRDNVGAAKVKENFIRQHEFPGGKAVWRTGSVVPRKL